MTSNARRRSTFEQAAHVDELPDGDETHAHLVDPARVAVRMMLERALATTGSSIGTVARDGAITLVTLPSHDWVLPARREWEAWARGDTLSGDLRRNRRDPDQDWVCWCPDGPPRPGSQADAAETFAMVVGAGRHCVGLVHDTSWLPEDLVLTADHVVAAAPLTPADLARVVEVLFGTAATTSLTDGQAAQLIPRLLRLARRPGMDADGYVASLGRLLDRLMPTRGGAGPRTAPSLERMHGMDEAIRRGLDLARDIAAYRDGVLAWIDVDGGCLLSGPSGCGKTMFARALAATCGVALVTASYAVWQAQGHEGDMLRAMAATFAQARASAPCILFLDEVDSFPDRTIPSGGNADYMIQVVNALLAEMDGAVTRKGVVLVGACNDPDRLDPALVRSGRLDRHIVIGQPSRDALAHILREHLGTDLAGQDLSTIALLAEGMTGADCEQLVRRARRRAWSCPRPLSLDDLLSEVTGNDTRSPQDLWTTSVHEAGHAIATAALWPGRLRAVSILERRDVMGLTTSWPDGSRLLRADGLRERLVILLAGRAAEEELLGQPSSGSGGQPGSDLAQATELAVAGMTSLALAGDGGLVWTGAPSPHDLKERLVMDRDLAGQVRARLDTAYDQAIQLMRLKRPSLVRLAALLSRQKVVDGAEVELMLVQDSESPS